MFFTSFFILFFGVREIVSVVLPFSVSQNQVVDRENQSYYIQGVSKSIFEYPYLDLEVLTNTSIDYDVLLIQKWNINTVRFPLRDVYWKESLYRERLHYFIDRLWERGILSIVDLHTQGTTYGLDPFMIRRGPPSYDAFQFWREVSESFLEKEYVWFELFNEPYGISPQTWWEGDAEYYGYREILQEIRGRTSRIVILGGLDYAYQWNFLHYHPEIYQELKACKNIVLATHPYGYKGRPVQNGTQTDPIPVHLFHVSPDTLHQGDCTTGYTLPTVPVSQYGWETSFGFLQKDFPLLLTEFGLDRSDTCLQGGWYMMELFQYIDTHPSLLGWVAWAWVRERLDYPSLLQEDFSPTGRARYPVHGPPCGVENNKYYSGPGNLIYTMLHRSHRSLIRYGVSTVPPTPCSIEWMFAVISCFVVAINLVCLLGFRSRKKEDTSYPRVPSRPLLSSRLSRARLRSVKSLETFV